MNTGTPVGIAIGLLVVLALGCSDASPPNPCRQCGANQVCVQLNDGTCSANGTHTYCQDVSDGCRSKLAASGSKSCATIPECESELCFQPYACRIASPCGNEVPEAAVYCYGP